LMACSKSCCGSHKLRPYYMERSRRSQLIRFEKQLNRKYQYRCSTAPSRVNKVTWSGEIVCVKLILRDAF
jgi:hypothetical protein